MTFQGEMNRAERAVFVAGAMREVREARLYGGFLVARPQTKRGPGGCMCAIIEVHSPNGEVRLARAEATTTCPVHGK